MKYSSINRFVYTLVGILLCSGSVYGLDVTKYNQSSVDKALKEKDLSFFVKMHKDNNLIVYRTELGDSLLCHASYEVHTSTEIKTFLAESGVNFNAMCSPKSYALSREISNIFVSLTFRDPDLRFFDAMMSNSPDLSVVFGTRGGTRSVGYSVIAAMIIDFGKAYKNRNKSYNFEKRNWTKQEVLDIGKKVITSLLDNNADPNFVPKLKYGRTPLFFAVDFCGSAAPEFVEILLSYGANPNIADYRGKKLISHVKETLHTSEKTRKYLIELLAKHGATE